MKTLHIFTSLLALLLATNASAQYQTGTAFQLYTDPLMQASGRTNLGAGAILGVYDRYLCDFGFHLSGNFQGQTLNEGVRGGQIQMTNRTIHTGVQVFPFGLHDKILFERRSHNERLRFHHRRKIDERVHRCPNSCFGRRDLNLDKWLKGFYIGGAYEFGKTAESYLDSSPNGPLKQISHQHGVQIDVGYTITVEFLSLSLNWAPVGLVSLPVNENKGKEVTPRSAHPIETKYHPDLTFKVGIALFN